MLYYFKNMIYFEVYNVPSKNHKNHKIHANIKSSHLVRNVSTLSLSESMKENFQDANHYTNRSNIYYDFAKDK